jgi:hypothetical protein
MNKIKNSITKTGKYLREISVIVIGVAITLSASQWINSRSEKRDVVLYLNSIKMELEEIIPEIDDEIIFLEKVKRYSSYLWVNDKESLHPDSIIGWGTGSIVSGNVNYIIPTTAFEMFKISGTMRLMGDKELLRSIWAVYNALEVIQRTTDNYFQLKKDYSLKEIHRAINDEPGYIPLYEFFIVHGNYGLLENCQTISEMLKDIIARL